MLLGAIRLLLNTLQLTFGLRNRLGYRVVSVFRLDVLNIDFGLREPRILQRLLRFLDHISRSTLRGDLFLRRTFPSLHLRTQFGLASLGLAPCDIGVGDSILGIEDTLLHPVVSLL